VEHKFRQPLRVFLGFVLSLLKIVLRQTAVGGYRKSYTSSYGLLKTNTKMKYKILKGTGGIIAIISFWVMFWNLKEIIWDKNYSHILRFTEGQVTNLELIFTCILIILLFSVFIGFGYLLKEFSSFISIYQEKRNDEFYNKYLQNDLKNLSSTSTGLMKYSFALLSFLILLKIAGVKELNENFFNTVLVFLIFESPLFTFYLFIQTIEVIVSKSKNSI